jgi:hypothetical protein
MVLYPPHVSFLIHKRNYCNCGKESIQSSFDSDDSLSPFIKVHALKGFSFK